MSKYIKLMDGTKSNAGGFEIKLNQVVISDKWDTSTFDPAIMGGFNFSTDEKILRWIHRGDTIYDVELPSDAEVIDCPSPNCPHGVFRSNKIILRNPRKLTEEMVMEFYRKSDLPEKTYYQCLVILSEFRNYTNVAKEILKEKINKENVDDCLAEFERFIADKHDGNHYDFEYNKLNDNAKKIYDELIKIWKQNMKNKVKKEEELAIFKLVDKLNLGKIVDNISRVSGGLLNRMYKVETTNGKFAIKWLNPEVMKRQNALNNHIFAEKIANIAKLNNVLCISANIYNGTAIQEIDGKYFFVFDWFEGKAINDEELTIEKVGKVSKQLALLHQIDFSMVENNSNLGKEREEVDWAYYAEKIDEDILKNLILDNIDYLYKLDKKSTIASQKIANNKVISHRDLDLPNILWDENENPVLIDWESSGEVNPCEELIETAWDWSGGQEYFDINKFKYFIKVYKDNGGNINDLEEAIWANFKNKSGWLEYNMKRVCGMECLDEEEKELGKKEVFRVINEILKFYKIMEEIDINIFK